MLPSATSVPHFQAVVTKTGLNRRSRLGFGLGAASTGLTDGVIGAGCARMMYRILTR